MAFVHHSGGLQIEPEATWCHATPLSMSEQGVAQMIHPTCKYLVLCTTFS